MINDLLKSFIEVIDSGSFSKAAEKLYISPTALMKQMNSLEAQVGVPLLIRTNHGISATNAGNSLYIDAKFMLEYSERAIERAHQAFARKSPNVIRVGNSMLNPCKELLDLWNEINPSYPEFKMNIVDDASEAWPTVYRTIGKEIDIIVGAYDEAGGPAYFNAHKLGEYRFCVAVSREHSLAKKELLHVTDLYGERLVMIKPDVSSCVDEIHSYLVTQHPQIQIKDKPQHYNIELFNHCAEYNAVLLTLDGWKDVHPSLVTIPVDWDYRIPYGILYSLKPSNNVKLFFEALQLQTRFNLGVETQLEQDVVGVGNYS